LGSSDAGLELSSLRLGGARTLVGLLLGAVLASESTDGLWRIRRDGGASRSSGVLLARVAVGLVAWLLEGPAWGDAEVVGTLSEEERRPPRATRRKASMSLALGPDALRCSSTWCGML